ncbi:hypothetical protein BKM03_14910 [Pseudomonas avellanae]|uniref:Uncharacterized protein n=1 Tax=Pseudomonas avellanae TaxID=46257 RepID=A0AAD0GQ90_9PSED|nr:hypothetical protein BKM03_14910 [Pseudomonas avellanae]POP86169.1 hypothetical protein CXB34_13995 [Pseudomonas amygdali pv. morsprunorum]
MRAKWKWCKPEAFLVALVVKVDSFKDNRNIGPICLFFLFFFCDFLPEPHAFRGGILKKVH